MSENQLSKSPTKSPTVHTATVGFFGYPKTQQKYEYIEESDASRNVHIAKCIDNNEIVAVKRISLIDSGKTLEDLMKEITIAETMRHDNVLKSYASFAVQNEMWLVTKYLDGGSLLNIIDFRLRALNCKNGVLDEVTIATVLKEVMKGLEYFHSNGHIHRDIKAANILLGLDGSVQIADYGVSASINDTVNKKHDSIVGTPCWIAPEIIQHTDKGYDTKVDIWSLGITLLEMVAGRPPYFKNEDLQILQLIGRNEPPTLETCEDEKDQYQQYSSTFRNLIANCLRKNPNERATATQLLRHEFLDMAKDKAYIAKYVALPLELRKKEIKEALDIPSITPNCRWLKSENGQWGCIIPEQVDNKKQNDKDANDVTFSNDIGENKSKEKSSRTFDKKRIRSKSVSVQPLHLVLRIRDEKKELTNIKFEFIPGKDTAELVSRDLVAEKFIDGADMFTVACYLDKLLEGKVGKSCTFQVKSGLSPNEAPDLETFAGYAQLINETNNTNSPTSNEKLSNNNEDQQNVNNSIPSQTSISSVHSSSSSTSMHNMISANTTLSSVNVNESNH